MVILFADRLGFDWRRQKTADYGVKHLKKCEVNYIKKPLV